MVAKDEKKWAVDPLSLFDQQKRVPLADRVVKERKGKP
jgi:hypothetical protein